MEITICSKKNCIKVEYMKSILELTKGLMFKEKGNALLEFPYKSRASIWMLFMKYPLWLYFLDENGKIIEKKYAVPLSINPKTWRIYKPNKKVKYVLEIDYRERFNAKINEKLTINR